MVKIDVCKLTILILDTFGTREKLKGDEVLCLTKKVDALRIYNKAFHYIATIPFSFFGKISIKLNHKKTKNYIPVLKDGLEQP